MQSLENITTEEIRQNWKEYKDIVDELSLFELIWNCFCKKNFIHNTYELQIFKNFIKKNEKHTIEVNDRKISYEYNDRILKINTTHI
jgi:hypothetical protein